MSVFTTKEIDYLNHQRLGRLATVDSDGNPHVVPVGFRHNLETDTIDIGGDDIAQNKKWGDIGQNPTGGVVGDDVFPPLRPRRVGILADAEILEKDGGGVCRGVDPPNTLV